ncbi:hypothetical protein COUCH_06490 [Couchioplanes caeruleus]|uniref:hypothetical protein n=1 Tax=Couchioplanes caeruleus TaxID=56438 RepID=UPI0020BEBAAA|nr:hypothetical protein [Couchioplanes caeruleus]UQU65948.1 hypothetical protein COUCH_06490 [Couchioplanes caeruleus]
MSDTTKHTTGRRSTVVLLGGLAAGAVLGAALGVTAGDAPRDASVQEQFRSAFTPGAAEAESLPINRIVVTEP